MALGNIISSEMKERVLVPWEECNDMPLWIMLRRNKNLWDCFETGGLLSSHRVWCTNWCVYGSIPRSYWFFLSVFWVTSFSDAAYWCWVQVCTSMIAIVHSVMLPLHPNTHTHSGVTVENHSACACRLLSVCFAEVLSIAYISAASELFFLHNPSCSAVAGDWSPDPMSWGWSLSHAGISQPIIKVCEVFIWNLFPVP